MAKTRNVPGSAPRAPEWACPRCGSIPVDPRNEQFEWCERCQGYTAIDNPNPAFAWVAFVGGDLDGVWRESELRILNVGEDFVPDGSADVYEYDGASFVFVRDV